MTTYRSLCFFLHFKFYLPSSLSFFTQLINAKNFKLKTMENIHLKINYDGSANYELDEINNIITINDKNYVCTKQLREAHERAVGLHNRSKANTIGVAANTEMIEVTQLVNHGKD